MVGKYDEENESKYIKKTKYIHIKDIGNTTLHNTTNTCQ